MVNGTSCIDVEGPTSGVAGIWARLDHLSLGCATTGIKYHLVDNVIAINDVHHEMWWYQGSSDWWGWMEGLTSGNYNHVDWDVCYLANPMISDVEFAFSGVAIKLTDCTVSSGFGNITFATSIAQGTNISFNEVCQAMTVASATTHANFNFSNVILYTDSTTSPVAGQCANAAYPNSEALQLNSDNVVGWINGLNGGLVNELGVIGGSGSGPIHGQLHLNQVVVQNYSAYANAFAGVRSDNTGSVADVADGFDYFFTSAVSPGNKCAGTCSSHVPYNDIAAHLGNCGNANPGAEVFVTDLLSAPVYLGTITTASGGGFNRVLAICNTGTTPINGTWQAH